MTPEIEMIESIAAKARALLAELPADERDYLDAFMRAARGGRRFDPADLED